MSAVILPWWSLIGASLSKGRKAPPPRLSPSLGPRCAPAGTGEGSPPCRQAEAVLFDERCLSFEYVTSVRPSCT